MGPASRSTRKRRARPRRRRRRRIRETGRKGRRWSPSSRRAQGREGGGRDALRRPDRRADEPVPARAFERAGGEVQGRQEHARPPGDREHRRTRPPSAARGPTALVFGYDDPGRGHQGRGRVRRSQNEKLAINGGAVRGRAARAEAVVSAGEDAARKEALRASCSACCRRRRKLVGCSRNPARNSRA